MWTSLWDIIQSSNLECVLSSKHSKVHIRMNRMLLFMLKNKMGLVSNLCSLYTYSISGKIPRNLETVVMGLDWRHEWEENLPFVIFHFLN